MDATKLPIDIHLNKLLDWILDRRHCPRDWQKSILPIRNKINLAIQDMPEHDEITSLLSGSTIHYYNCLKIVEILKETEKNSKNIFGMYSSQRMKDWNAVIGLFQKNNVYLAEAASILMRNVQYEIPALKKAISKCQQQQTECDDKHVSYNKTISEINLQIKQLCQELGIAGVNISSELKMLPSQLTPVFNEIADRAAKLNKALDYYTGYVEYFFKRNPNDLVQTLRFVIKNGNKTVYEWRTGASPKQIERPAEAEFKFDDEAEKQTLSDEINFDIDIGAAEPSQSGGGDQDNNKEGEAIDWGDFDMMADSAANVNIDTLEIDYDMEALKQEIQVEEAGVYIPTDGIAKGDDALYLLELPGTRNLFLNDLVKLKTFLTQKLNEMKTESDNLLLSTIMQDTPKSIQSVTEKDIKQYIQLVADLLGYFSQKKVEQLFRINDSPKYLKRLYEQFKMKQKSISRAHLGQEQLKVKAQELSQEEKELNAKQQLLIQKTKELQKHVAADLSKKYNGSRINIMGEINLI